MRQTDSSKPARSCAQVTKALAVPGVEFCFYPGGAGYFYLSGAAGLSETIVNPGGVSRLADYSVAEWVTMCNELLATAEVPVTENGSPLVMTLNGQRVTFTVLTLEEKK